MDKKTDSAIKQYIHSVAGKMPGLISAYVFGSYAKNTNTPDSDIDIALIIDNLRDSERFDLQIQLMLIASQIDNRIEPHPVSKNDMNSGSPFVYEIIKNGIEIKIK
jgi:uncharacterized protein